MKVYNKFILSLCIVIAGSLWQSNTCVHARTEPSTTLSLDHTFNSFFDEEQLAQESIRTVKETCGIAKSFRIKKALTQPEAQSLFSRLLTALKNIFTLKIFTKASTEEQANKSLNELLDAIAFNVFIDTTYANLITLYPDIKPECKAFVENMAEAFVAFIATTFSDSERAILIKMFKETPLQELVKHYNRFVTLLVIHMRPNAHIDLRDLIISIGTKKA